METEEKITKEKEVVHENGHDYASKGVAGSGLGLGIAGTALGLMALWGSGIGRPAQGNGSSSPSAFDAWRNGCDEAISLTNKLWELKVNTQEQMYAHRDTDISEKFQLWKSQIDADHSLYRSQVDADFGLYKSQRDMYDLLNERYSQKFCELDKKVAVLEATRPYHDRLIQAEIDRAYNAAVCYTDRKTAYSIKGQVVLPSTPTVTGYGSYYPYLSSSSSSSGSTATS